MTKLLSKILARINSSLWLGAFLLCAVSAPALAELIDNGDGTVTDDITGLMWDQCNLGQTGISCSTGAKKVLTWFEASNAAVTANAANYKGKNDWRLPNIKELESIVDLQAQSPAVDSIKFPQAQASIYWSSTYSVAHKFNVLVVNFLGGQITTSGIGELFVNYVRLVRSGQHSASFDSLQAKVPVLSAIAVSGTTHNSTTVVATLDMPGTGYWLVLPQGSTPPTAAQVKAGAAYPGGTPVAAGSGPMAAGAAASFVVTGLSPATSYMAYVVGEDATQLLSNLGGPATFRTLADGAVVTPSGVTPVPTLGQWGLWLLSGALGLFGWAGLRRRGA